MNRLDGKVALISGAARGIGAETARLMVEAGAKVVIGDLLDERGRETARGLGDAALYVHLDVTAEADWNTAIAAAVSRFGKLDILVNNAGLFLGKDIESASLDEWHRLCAVNLTGVFLGTKLAIPALREAAQTSPHGSAIVNLASTAGIVGSTQDPLYSMTKGGVTLFTKSAALEFARKGYRIRVNSMHPGTIDTDMGDQVLVTRARNLGTNDVEAARAQVIERLPIGRMGTPTDIAKGHRVPGFRRRRVHDRRRPRHRRRHHRAVDLDRFTPAARQPNSVARRSLATAGPASTAWRPRSAARPPADAHRHTRCRSRTRPHAR
jgi:NAD(P)-dependent dehydrogenase (short-subunit alcohol dehydrogenase family)